MTTLRPRAWRPPKDPGLEGRFAPNDRLSRATRIEIPGEGPEDVAVTADGRVVFGTADGQVTSMASDGSDVRPVVHTGGRPLGIEAHPDGRLIVCDALRGLLAVRDDRVEVLASAFEGEPFLLTNNSAIGTDGTVYFSVSSTRFALDEYRNDLLEHSNTGRLFALRPDGDLELLMSGLSFANGVAISSDGAWVYVAETGEYRIRRLSTTTPRSDEVFVANLPGIPDNLSAADGIVWAAMFTPRNRPLDVLLPRPRLRRIVASLPERVQPQPVRHGFVLGFDEMTGEVRHNLQDPAGGYAPVTAARFHDGRLWLGSLTEPAVAYLDL